MKKCCCIVNFSGVESLKEKEVVGFYCDFKDVKKVEVIFFDIFRCGKIKYVFENC